MKLETEDVKKGTAEIVSKSVSKLEKKDRIGKVDLDKYINKIV